MPRPHLLRRSALVVVALLVLALIATTVVGLVVVRRPLPQTSGELTVPGLGASVQVVRDERGVPHIYAESTDDLFFAQGFSHAQDRFFEMDYRRHVTAGRLSELVGANETALAADKVIRTLGWRRVAEQELPMLAESSRAHLEAYAKGVNAYLAQRDPAELAIEYTVLGLQVDVAEPEPWTPVDSIAWLKAMAWDLKTNYDDEVARAQLYSTLRDVELVEDLFPDYPQATNLPILPGDDADEELLEQRVSTSGAAASSSAGARAHAVLDAGARRAVAAAADALAAVPALYGQGDGVGSNSWVGAGEHTASGKPILANDPHLSVSAPGIWSQQALHCVTVTDECPFDVAGFTFAGFPGVVIGHNEHLAWGLTNLGPDVADLFVERITAEGYEYDGETHSLVSREEIIKVAGGEDVPITVRSTRHGPIVSDVLSETHASIASPLAASGTGRVYEVALSWTALQPARTADAVFQFALAQDASDIAEAAALFAVPSQNIVFATVDGDIGYQAPGLVPIRGKVRGDAVPADGSWPRPGWDSEYDWQGFVDAEDMPAVLNPDEGYIVTANQAVTPRRTGPFLTNDWDYGFRSQRIRALLNTAIASGPLDVPTMNDVQNDAWSPFADALVPALLSVRIESDFDAAGQQLLRLWDRSMDTDSAAAVYFGAVWHNLLELTFHDELSEEQWPEGGSRWLEVVRGLLDDRDSAWWDNRRTVGVVEGRDEILSQALTAARGELTVMLGKDPSQWSWGKLHVLAPTHPVLGGETVPAPVRALVNPQPLGVSGGSSIINANGWDASIMGPQGHPDFSVTTSASMRMVVDLGDLDSSTWVTLTGTSGHPASRHYTDQFGTWASGGTFPWPFTRAAVSAAGVESLRLVPPR